MTTDLMKLSKIIRDLNKDNNIFCININTKEVEVYNIGLYGIDYLVLDNGYYIEKYFYVDGVKFYETDILKRGMDNVFLD